MLKTAAPRIYIKNPHRNTFQEQIHQHRIYTSPLHIPPCNRQTKMRFSALTTALLCATAQSLTLVDSGSTTNNPVDIVLPTGTLVDTVIPTDIPVHPHNRHSRLSRPNIFVTSASASPIAVETMPASMEETIAGLPEEVRKSSKCPVLRAWSRMRAANQRGFTIPLG